MKQRMICKFIGNPDEVFPHLERGQTYILEVEAYKEFLFFGKRQPVIITPFLCPYSSWESFYQNWEEVEQD